MISQLDNIITSTHQINTLSDLKIVHIIYRKRFLDYNIHRQWQLVGLYYHHGKRFLHYNFHPLYNKA